jgi:hypothetical protein
MSGSRSHRREACDAELGRTRTARFGDRRPSSRCVERDRRPRSEWPDARATTTCRSGSGKWNLRRIRSKSCSGTAAIPPLRVVDGLGNHRVMPARSAAAQGSTEIVWTDRPLLYSRQDDCAGEPLLAAEGTASTQTARWPCAAWLPNRCTSAGLSWVLVHRSVILRTNYPSLQA